MTMRKKESDNEKECIYTAMGVQNTSKQNSVEYTRTRKLNLKRLTLVLNNNECAWKRRTKQPAPKNIKTSENG